MPKFLILLAILTTAASLPRPAHAVVDFKGPIHWNGWEAANKLASAKKKPMLLLLHTDSCPKCVLLGHVFAENKDVQKLAKDFVMTEVNGGTAPMPVVQKFARFGNYYPRVIFLQPDATPMEQITSANQNFPYYFQPSRPEVLIDAMKRALAVRAAAVPKAAPHGKHKG